MKKKGTYLIRFSSRIPNCFTITYVKKRNELVSFRVQKEGIYFLIGDKKTTSMKDVINQSIKKPITHPNGKYGFVFEDHQSYYQERGGYPVVSEVNELVLENI